MAEEARFGKIGNWGEMQEKIQALPSPCGAMSLYYHEWAERPVILSDAFYKMETPESKMFSDGIERISEVMCGVDSIFLHEFGKEIYDEYMSEKGFRDYLLDRFKDPGILHHAVFWDFGKDTKAIIFEWHHRKDHSKICLDMLRGQNYDIYGKPCLVDSIRGPWESLVDLYHEQINNPREDYYGMRLFRDVIGWPFP